MSDYLETLDFDAFGDEPFDFTALDNAYPIGQEDQEPTLGFDLSPLPDATAAPVEPLMNAGTHTAFSSIESIATPRVHETSSESTAQPQSNGSPEDQQHESNTFGHYRVQSLSCAECHVSFPTKGQLHDHFWDSRHTFLECSCGMKFTRSDSLTRHCNSFRKAVQRYPCTSCRKHRSNHAFRRRDHLIQHLRGYHKLEDNDIKKAYPDWDIGNKVRYMYTRTAYCPYLGCEYYRGEEYERLPWYERYAHPPFQKISDYSKHLRDVHKVTPFPCPVSGCDRTGAKGYFTEIGFRKHLAEHYPDDPQALEEVKREKLWTGRRSCDICGKECLDVERFNLHLLAFH